MNNLLVQNLSEAMSLMGDTPAGKDAPTEAAGAVPAAVRGTSSVDKFTADNLPLARRVGEQMGVDPSLLLGQWGLETGWGKSVIPGTNNLGNIKDFSGKGAMATDNMTGSRDAYRTYASADDFGTDFNSLISRRYKGAMNTP
jgi:flagellum-specific peptidoglycan hydrolase FlgJ